MCHLEGGVRASRPTATRLCRQVGHAEVVGNLTALARNRCSGGAHRTLASATRTAGELSCALVTDSTVGRAGAGLPEPTISGTGARRASRSQSSPRPPTVGHSYAARSSRSSGARRAPQMRTGPAGVSLSGPAGDSCAPTTVSSTSLGECRRVRTWPASVWATAGGQRVRWPRSSGHRAVRRGIAPMLSAAGSSCGPSVRP